VKDKDESFFKYETSKRNSDKEGEKKSLYEQEDMEDVYGETIKNVEKTFKFSSKAANFLAPIAMSTIIAASSVFLIEKGFEIKRSFKARGWIEANCPNLKSIIFKSPRDLMTSSNNPLLNNNPLTNSIGGNIHFSSFSPTNPQLFEFYELGEERAWNDPVLCYSIAASSAEYFIPNVDNP